MNKQIEEMARVLCNNCAGNESPCRVAKSGKMCASIQREAEALYNAGYRKQSEGEWVFEFTLDDDDFYKCSACGGQVIVNGLCKERSPVEHYPYCHCGARMTKGESK